MFYPNKTIWGLNDLDSDEGFGSNMVALNIPICERSYSSPVRNVILKESI